jgi:hypothetical protein
MNIEEVNLQLMAEYEKYLSLIKNTDKNEIANYDNHSLPLFMSVAQEYLDSTTKILFVGKETYYWHDLLSNINGYSVEKIRGKYGFDQMKWNTPFWRFVKNTCEGLNILCDTNIDKGKSKYGFMWTNISKMDANKKSPALLKSNYQFYGLNLLEKEIKILNPDIVIFLTSYYYDQLIDLAIPGIFKCYVKAYEDIPLYLAKANFDNRIFYRSYHPRFLNSSNAKYKIKGVVDLLTRDYFKHRPN